MKDKERLRNRCRLKEIKERNVKGSLVLDARLDPELL
jgi:hypothetical protein